ncbi:alanyl-tRNA editing protein [Actinosynnema sp. NPDC023658]|uniref:alanyl-tRNA editing protein n=1 Tax=Actinosynnema sp. NPDC023658 TaxID=3155465 RepID=UPI0033E41C81
MVAKIYIDDPYQCECVARVTRLRGNTVFVSQTVFYPEGGGQIGDTGWIGESRVVDTQKFGGRPFGHPDFPDMIMIDGEVEHRLADDTPTPVLGAEVEVRIDWEQRYRNMRHHSAAHLGFWFASALRPDLYTRGVRIDGNTARFDFSVSRRFTTEEVAEMEHLANEVITKDLEIRTAGVSGEREARMWYSGDMMIPCGGTHVRSTGEIGHVKMRRKSHGKAVERLYITTVEPGS